MCCPKTSVLYRLTDSTGEKLICRTLEKLTSQDRHLQAVIDATTVEAPRPLFVFEMTVEPVPPTDNITVVVPLTPDGATVTPSPLAFLTRAMYESVKPKITTRLINIEVLELMTTLKKRNTALLARTPQASTGDGTNTGVVHCECGLVALLHKKSPD